MTSTLLSLRHALYAVGVVLGGSAVVVSACDGAGTTPAEPSSQPDSSSEAGTSSSGEDAPAPPDAIAPGTYARLINDDTIWSEVPTPAGGGGPVLHQARVSPEPFPRRAWEACGVGCQVTPAGLPFDIKLVVDPAPVVAGDYVDGDAFLLMTYATKEVSARLTRLERLSDGTTVAAVVARNQRTNGQLAYGGGASPFVLILGAAGTTRMARASSDGRVDWQPGWRSDIPLSGAERIGLGDGMGLATYGGLLLFPSSAAASPLEIEPGTRLAHARGSQLFFGYGAGTIHSFTYAGGATPIVTLPNGRLAVGVRTSAERLVWIDGVRPTPPLFRDMRVHWSPLPKDAASVVVNDGPALPVEARGGFDDMHATGDWVILGALFGPTDDNLAFELVAINTASGSVYRVPNRPGRVFMRALALTNTELVIGYKNGTRDSQAIDELVRIELASLPDVVARWAAGKL
ncbi:MAG: hypothetical protein JST00_40000 [Deltaproteobacteria bacterium]|nr:hypothetical protein [Deltaproteobacteria bacterium]